MSAWASKARDTLVVRGIQAATPHWSVRHVRTERARMRAFIAPGTIASP